MKLWVFSVVFIAVSASADQGALIAKARDALVERSIQKLKSYCQGTSLVQQEHYVYLCHLQVKADCESKKPKACDVLKESEELERQALVTEKSVESIKPAPIYSSHEVREEVLTYNVSYGSPQVHSTHPKELREQLEKLEAMRQKINPLKVRLDCDADSQCRLQHFGKKGCGGPMGSIVYSTRGTDLAKLANVEEFTSLDKQIQDQWSEKLGWGSTCEYLGLFGKLTCENSVCVLR